MHAVRTHSRLRRIARSCGAVAALVLTLMFLVESAAPVAGQDESAAQAAQPPTTAIPSAYQADRVAIITIHDEINATTATSFERRMALAEDGGADAVVLDIETPGGEVGAVLDINRMIRESAIPTIIAWINPTAYSGGAIIALACDEIVVAPNATLGDAAPIVPFIADLGETERMKVLSPLLADLIESARANGYDENLVQSFVVLGVETWMIEHKPTGTRYFVTPGEYRALFGETPPDLHPRVGAVGSKPAAGPGAAPAPPAPSGPGAVDGFKPASDRIVFTEDQYDSLNLALTERSRRPNFSKEDADDYELIEKTTDGSMFLTLKAYDLIELGFAEHTIADDDALKSFMGAAEVRRLEENWSEKTFGPVAHAWWYKPIQMLSIIVFLIAMFIEMSVPGIGVAGAIALLALGVLIVPPLMVNAALWWTFIAIIAGIVLIALEVFVFPGVGVPGVTGLICLMAGLVGSLAGTGEVFPGANDGGGQLTWSVSIVLVCAFLAGLGMYFFSRYTHSFPIAGRMILSSGAEGDRGESLLAAMAPMITSAHAISVGDRGRVTTTLRPAGTAEFDDALVDVVSEGGYVEQGRAVRVVDVTGNRVVVEAIEDEAPPPPADATDTEESV